jgi:hypothetical protein
MHYTEATIIVTERKGRGVNSVRMQKGNYTQRELYSGWGEVEGITTRYWTLLGKKSALPDDKMYNKP